MLKDLNYVAFDLETTGLDTTKDKPIQVGLLKFNNKFEILDKYTSNINPKKDIKELKDIVSFITGLSLSDLTNAPDLSQISKNIRGFFDEKTVVVGHNIKFDIDIITRFIKIDYFAALDTYNLARAVIHFVPSYSLEILSEVLKEKGVDYSLFDGEGEGKLAYHNALYDSLSSYNLMKFFAERLELLTEKYPVLKDMIYKSSGVFKDIFKIPKAPYDIEFDKYFLPALKIEVKKPKKVTNPMCYDFSRFDNAKKIYTGNIQLRDLISRMLCHDKVILSFSSRAKLNIVKGILQELGVTDVGFLKQDTVLDSDRIKLFMQKQAFEDFEVEFLIKYFSLHDGGYGLLDLTSKRDYMIYNFLKKSSSKSKQGIILTIHQGLLEAIKNKKEYINDYQIFYFDWDWWYYTFVRHINQAFDFYRVLDFAESVHYEYSFENKDISKLDDFISFFQIFIGVIFGELVEKFKNHPNRKLELDPIVDNIDYPKTNKLISRFDEFKKEFEEEKYELNGEVLCNYINEIIYILNNIILAEIRTFSVNGLYFVFHSTTNVINYQEFLSSFNDNNVLFFTNFDKQNSHKLDPDYEEKKSENKVGRINDINSFLKNLGDNENIFILSTIKARSKEFFEMFFDNNYHVNYDIFVENITGGLGKNVFYSKKSKKKIVIGGFEFFLALIYEKVKFDNVFVYEARGAMEKNIIKDMYYYGGL